MREKASRPHRAFHKGWTLTVTRRLPRKAQAEWKKERRGERERERDTPEGAPVLDGASLTGTSYVLPGPALDQINLSSLTVKSSYNNAIYNNIQDITTKRRVITIPFLIFA